MNINSQALPTTSSMVDDYGGYKALFSEKQPRPSIELACWAHARRKFFDLKKPIIA